MNSTVNDGGITKINGPFPYIGGDLIPEIGKAWEIWLNDRDTRNLEYGNLIPALVANFGPVGLIIALLISAHIMYLKIRNNGKGIVFNAVLLYFPVQGPCVRNVRSQ